MSPRPTLTIAGAMLSATFLAACQTPDVDRPNGETSTVTVAYCCGDEALNPIHDMDAKKLVFLPLMDRDSLGNLAGPSSLCLHRGIAARIM